MEERSRMEERREIFVVYEGKRINANELEDDKVYSLRLPEFKVSTIDGRGRQGVINRIIELAEKNPERWANRKDVIVEEVNFPNISKKKAEGN